MDFEILAEVEALRESARVSPEYSGLGLDHRGKSIFFGQANLK